MMAEAVPLFELLQICESTSQSWPINFYNPFTGAAAWSYKGSELQSEPPGDAVLVGDEHLLIPLSKKSLAISLNLSSKNRTVKRSILPGPIDCIAVSSTGLVCCGAIKENLYSWTLNDGKLLTIASGHYQSISKVLFTSDDCYVITGGKDGHIFVWNVGELLTPQDSISSKINPVRKWLAHSLAVTDMRVGFGGVAARVYSVSVDQTAKIHCLASGALLITLFFDCPISSCVIDNAETRFFVGTKKGDIRRVDLYVEPILRERHVDLNLEANDNMFKGHKQAVNSLSINIDGTLLASASDDCEVRVWHVNSRQCIRTIHCKGPPTKVLFVPRFPSLYAQDFCTTTQIALLMKTVTENLDGYVTISSKRKSENMDGDDLALKLKHLVEEEHIVGAKGKTSMPDHFPGQEKCNQLKSELAKTKLLNKKLYDFCMEKILLSN